MSAKLMRGRASEYLAMRRRLGFKLDTFETALNSFLDFCDQRDVDTIRVVDAVEWATHAPHSTSPVWHAMRLSAIRLFAEYLLLRDHPGVEVPPQDLLPARARRRVPFILTDTQVVALMDACSTVVTPAFKAHTCAFLIGLLSCTGMRISEACHLDLNDIGHVILPTGGGTVMTLRIRNAKFDKSRTIPLHPSTAQEVASYVTLRNHIGGDNEQALIVDPHGHRFSPDTLRHHIWPRLLTEAGIDQGGPSGRPRPHDLRHGFTLNTLIRWYRDGQVNIDARIDYLATYLGHHDPASTYWYLTGTPELLSRAGERLTSVLARGE